MMRAFIQAAATDVKWIWDHPGESITVFCLVAAFTCLMGGVAFYRNYNQHQRGG